MIRPKYNPSVWILTTFVIATYAILCVFVNPPFLTIGSYDQSAIDTRITDYLALITICWIFGGLIINRLAPMRPVSTIYIIGVFGLILLLAGVFFSKAHQTNDEIIRGHWLGQGVGVLGFGWLIIIRSCFRILKCEHAPPAGRGEAPRP